MATSPLSPLSKNGARRATYIGLGAAALLALWWALQPDPVAVEVSQVTVGPMEVTIDNQGQVRVHDKYVIGTPVAAELERIELHEGDKVRKGQVLAVLRPLPMDTRQREEAVARLDAARALARAAELAVQGAAADQRLAASELKRVESLVAQGFMSSQSVDRARSADTVSRAELRAAKARRDAAVADVRTAQAALPPAGLQRDTRKLELQASVDGLVLRVHEKSARTVAAGTPLVTIGDPARAEVVVDVLSADAVKIKPGALMRLEQWGGGKTLQATVRTIEPEAFTKMSALGIEEQRVNIIGDPVESLAALGDGYRLEARIVIWSAADVVSVPASSVFRAGEDWHLFTVQDGKARERKVTVGQRNASRVQILDGVNVGDPIVRFRGNALADGVSVSATGRSSLQ